MTIRHRLSVAVTAALLAAGLIALVPGVTSAAAPPPGTVTVEGYELIGEVTFPTGYVFEDTEVGGLSGIVYDRARDVYYSLSDDQGQIDPTRYYSVEIDVSDGSLDDGDIRFVEVTTLLDENGQPFAAGSLDPEGIALATPGRLLMSSEGNALVPTDPFIRRYNLNGRQTAEYPVDDKYSPDGTGVSGVRQNLAFESLAVTPDHNTLYTATEGALAQDGPAADVGVGSLARVAEYDLAQRTAGAEYVYVTEPVAEPPDPPDAFRVNGLVDLLPIDNAGTMLALERSFSVGKGNTVWLFEVSTVGATDVSGIPDLYDESSGTPAAFTPVSKRFLLDVEADLGLVADNLEGLAWGPPLPDGRQLLIIVSDNNFSPGQVTQFIGLALDVGVD
jgi:hypothetical protein